MSLTKDEVWIKERLGIPSTDSSRDMEIKDSLEEVSAMVRSYCHITDIPDDLMLWVRRKAYRMINYDINNVGNAKEAKSISEGDTSITFNMDESNTYSGTHSLTKDDKKYLMRFRDTP